MLCVVFIFESLNCNKTFHIKKDSTNLINNSILYIWKKSSAFLFQNTSPLSYYVFMVACTIHSISGFSHPPAHYVRFSLLFWHFRTNLVMQICSMFQGQAIGFILNLWRLYTTFSAKNSVFRANSDWLLGTKWQKWWLYINVSKIVKVIHTHSAIAIILHPPILSTIPVWFRPQNGTWDQRDACVVCCYILNNYMMH